MIFYKMQNLQRKEALNQKVEENKPVLELKNTGKKVCQNIWKELFYFTPHVNAPYSPSLVVHFASGRLAARLTPYVLLLLLQVDK